jgi:tetratricopeptide (TPR) repeat protein
MAERPAVNMAVNDALEIAKSYQLSGHLDKAIEAYRKALKIDPENAEVNHNLGLIEAQCHDAVAALGRFERAVLAKPEIEQYWVSYIESLIQTGAIESVADALDLGMKYGLRATTAQKLAANVIDDIDIN